MLARSFFDLSTYALQAIKRALHPPDRTSIVVEGLPPAVLDVMLPKVCEALVLVTQCIVTITLEADQTENFPNRTGSESGLKTFFNQVHFSDIGLLESLLGEDP